MSAALTDRGGRRVTLRAVDDDNWRAIADIAPRDDQRDFVAALAARYLLLSMRGGVWTSLGVLADETVVGHVMWAYDEDDEAYWIGGVVIDASEQGKGVGRQAMLALIQLLSERPNCREIRLSYSPRNTGAAKLYEALGFAPTGEVEDDEIVVRLLVE
ncbi:GNAT family N-acetyltransferase [Luteipulveratus mongoliensis]|uniref:Acetyltransferase n=1 Tax=Luteipulveratus mongoliensis TaxID=571913 RepID=A0A0K1JN02_9MICO|nr:GNAT family N-acetyltransferase [Luteipulveratus mongoliensis]AKU18094.1 acetyltransferase [Luteipulveratus mongoliensis]